MDKMRQAYQQMCRTMPGGWSAMAAALGMSKDGLENRVYERKGQSVSVQEAQLMERFSDTTLFAEVVAEEAGGVFVPLQYDGLVDNAEIGLIYMELVDEVGKLAREWRESTRDGEVDARERRRLEQLQQAICTKVLQMNELTFKIFCRAPEGVV